MKVSSKISFIVALVFLGACAMALEGATQFMRLHFRKERVELAKPLETLPNKLGSWVQVSNDEPLPEEMEHALGTTQYIFRQYLDTRLLSSDVVTTLKDRTPQERSTIAANLQMQHPEGVIQMMVTYYTGLVDTVAHVPDRCYIADGYAVGSYDVLNWPVAGKQINARYVTFEDTTGQGRVSKNVGYFFQTNGKYVDDPIAVRRILADLFARYGYYAKVELMTIMPDRKKSADVMNDFLNNALPSIETSLPDWKHYESR